MSEAELDEEHAFMPNNKQLTVKTFKAEVFINLLPTTP